jgi:primosomal protein N' (replication factor Y)
VSRFATSEGAPGTGAAARDGVAPRAVADHHVLVRVSPEQTLELTHALVALKAVRSARKEGEVVTVRMDPLDMF